MRYDRIADYARRQQRTDEPYRGVGLLFNADMARVSQQERREWVALPGYPDILIRVGYVAVNGYSLPLDSPQVEELFVADPLLGEQYLRVNKQKNL